MANEIDPPKDAQAETELRHRSLPNAHRPDRVFVVVAHPAREPEIIEVVDGQPLLIGRDPTAAIRVDEAGVSRRHASLAKVGTAIELKDLGSKNGVLRNGKAIGADAVMLNGGDRVVVGPVTLSVALLSDEAGVADATATIEPNVDVVIEDAAMRALFALLPRIAASPVAVLVTGETGVGKEVVVAELHRLSERASARFVRLNCAAIPEGLVESELFGFERGAFTGADRQRPGHMEAANGGTLLLDEVGELPRAAQAKLLRALETSTIMRVGGSREIKLDLRIVSATNRDLQEEIRAGRFRADLYYRLNGVALHIPPLRERANEIPAMARLFAARLASRMNEPPPTISNAAMAALQGYRWPGNVRELKQVIERALVLATNRAIDVDHLGLATNTSRQAQGPTGPLTEDIENLERRTIEQALAASNGNRTHAASALGISRRTLLYKLEKYGLGKAESS